MRFEDIHTILKEETKADTPHSVTNTERILLRIYENFNLLTLINSIKSNDEYLNIVASQSYEHQIGFDKIVIHPYQDTNFQLRINAWWKSLEDNFENIHNHRWDFSTILLNGKYCYENYRIDEENGEEKHWYNYFPRDNSEFSLKYCGSKKLRVFASGSLEKGNYMSLKFDIPHRIVNISEKNTFSLFLNTKPKTQYTDVFSEYRLNNQGENISSPSMNIQELVEKFKRLLEASEW